MMIPTRFLLIWHYYVNNIFGGFVKVYVDVRKELSIINPTSVNT